MAYKYDRDLEFLKQLESSDLLTTTTNYQFNAFIVGLIKLKRLTGNYL
nr:DUF3944 domain-containing protein [Helicobacter pylori]